MLNIIQSNMKKLGHEGYCVGGFCEIQESFIISFAKYSWSAVLHWIRILTRISAEKEEDFRQTMCTCSFK